MQLPSCKSGHVMQDVVRLFLLSGPVYETLPASLMGSRPITTQPLDLWNALILPVAIKCPRE